MTISLRHFLTTYFVENSEFFDLLPIFYFLKMLKKSANHTIYDVIAFNKVVF